MRPPNSSSETIRITASSVFSPVTDRSVFTMLSIFTARFQCPTCSYRRHQERQAYYDDSTHRPSFNTFRSSSKSEQELRRRRSHFHSFEMYSYQRSTRLRLAGMHELCKCTRSGRSTDRPSFWMPTPCLSRKQCGNNTSNFSHDNCHFSHIHSGRLKRFTKRLTLINSAIILGIVWTSTGIAYGFEQQSLFLTSHPSLLWLSFWNR